MRWKRSRELAWWSFLQNNRLFVFWQFETIERGQIQLFSKIKVNIVNSVHVHWMSYIVECIIHMPCASQSGLFSYYVHVYYLHGISQSPSLSWTMFILPQCTMHMYKLCTVFIIYCVSYTVFIIHCVCVTLGTVSSCWPLRVQAQPQPGSPHSHPDGNLISQPLWIFSTRWRRPLNQMQILKFSKY